MNHIEELIERLCPDGVVFRELAEVFDLRNGYTPSKSDAANWNGGTIPWFRMDDLRERGHILEDSTQHVTLSAIKRGEPFPKNSLIVATSATIGEHALITVPFLANQRFTVLSLKPEFSKSIDMKFAYFYCFVLDDWSRRNTTTSSFATVDMNGFKRFRFPVPPLEVQHEIVKILDTFTDLESELESELESRRLQYQLYQEKLLAPASDTPWLPLGKIGLFSRGNGLQKKDLREDGFPAIHYGQIHTLYGVLTRRTKSFVSSDAAKRLKIVHPGDLIIATTSEDDKDVAKATAWLGDGAVAISGDSYGFHHDLDPRYVAYFFQSRLFQDQKGRYITGTKVRRISGDSMSKIRIPIPPRESQHRVARQLEVFDALVNDLNSGLPAELNARRQQYEYYRDKLLTFKELKS